MSLITAVHLFVCVLLIIIVLLQQGRGADMGATFGGGSNTLFGASGADNLLSRVTTFCAMIFMVTSVYLAVGMKPGIANSGRLDSAIPNEDPVQTIPMPVNGAANGAATESESNPSAEGAPIADPGAAAPAPVSAPPSASSDTAPPTGAAANAPAGASAPSGSGGSNPVPLTGAAPSGGSSGSAAEPKAAAPSAPTAPK